MTDRLQQQFSAASIQQMLGLVREHLDMEVAFVGEFVDSRRLFRYVSAAAHTNVTLEVGQGDPLDESFCHRIVTGALDAIIPDAGADPRALQLPATRDLGVGAHVGTPITLQDGRVYGTLCTFRRGADASLGPRDLKFLRLIAALIGERLSAEEAINAGVRTRRARIERALAAGDPSMAFQPIVALESGRVEGYEALARFGGDPACTPEIWFSDARAVGLDSALEQRAMTAALKQRPAAPGSYLSINISPAVLCDPAIIDILETTDCSRVVLEVTELGDPTNPSALRPAVDALRSRGVRVALDDVGAGYSGMCRLLEIAPDIIKLDREITRGVATDPVRQSLVTATVSLCAAVGTTLIAEGIEFSDDLLALRRLGILYGQGFYLGRPALPDAAA